MSINLFYPPIETFLNFSVLDKLLLLIGKIYPIIMRSKMDSQASAIVDGKETSQQDLDDNNEVSTGEAFSNLEAVEAPKDNYYFVFWVTFLQGMGVLFPWNSFLAEPVYFT